MTRYTIRTVGNPSLYRSLRESLASETHHRTVTGALRRLEKINRDGERWAKNIGVWGSLEVERDGVPLDQETIGFLTMCVSEARLLKDEPWAYNRAKQLLSN